MSHSVLFEMCMKRLFQMTVLYKLDIALFPGRSRLQFDRLQYAKFVGIGELYWHISSIIDAFYVGIIGQ